MLALPSFAEDTFSVQGGGVYTPDIDTFRALAREGNLIPVARQILADMETPVSALRKIDSGNYAFLLESIEGGEKWGRYSFLGSNPSLVFRAKGQHLEVLRGEGREVLRDFQDPLAALSTLLKQYRAVRVPELPRLTGGMVGYLSYDIVRHLERLPVRTQDDLDLPDALFLMTDTLLIFDNVTHRITVVSNAVVQDDTPGGVERAYREAQQKIEAIIAALRRPVGAPLGRSARLDSPRFESNFTREQFCDAVARTKAYVEAGDIIQAVLSQRLSVKTDVDPFDVYRALRVVNPSPYMYYLRLGEMKLVGSSPEILVRLEGDRIDLRPIAGTRPRGTKKRRTVDWRGSSRPIPRNGHIISCWWTWAGTMSEGSHRWEAWK